MREIISFFIIMFVLNTVRAQNSSSTDGNLSVSDFYKFRNEIGINVTNILGNVLSLNPNNTTSPYGITYRRHYDKTSLRTGLSINYNNLSQNDFSGTFFTRKFGLVTSDMRVGFEKHLVLSRKMMFSYGIDALFGYSAEHSEIVNFNSATEFISDQTTLGLGGGPVMRIEFKLSDRLFFSTECSLYAFYNSTSETLTENGVISEEPQKTSTNLSLTLPQTLYFNISF